MDIKIKRQHTGLAQGRWAQMSLCEQMSHIGSEINRAINWQNKNKPDISKRAVIRALELIDLSLETASTFPRLKEIARLRETVVDFFYGSNEFLSTPQSLMKYFFYFHYALRKHC